MCLLTYAVDDPPSFKNLETWRKEFVYYADVKADFPFLVVGNKVHYLNFFSFVISRVLKWNARVISSSLLIPGILSL